MVTQFVLQHLLSYTSFASTASVGLHCKPTPGSTHWPDINAWQTLNSSVSGRLISPTPPGAVCHPTWSVYNNETCSFVAGQWTNTSFHALNPVSVDYNDETCLPNATYPCSAVGYPSYIVNASCAGDVQHAVTFARETGVRLVIRGTGHDFTGRSSGSNSLSLYTHNIRGLDLIHNDRRATALGGIASLKIHAGERMTDIYTFAADNNITVVGGADPGVGIGGWLSAGGHSPISAKYGMGADQVIEMEVVTADGEVRVISEHVNADLFWALRGGGPSTFAVLVSVTVKVYPSVLVTEYLFAYNTTAGSDTFWSMSAYFHSQLPRLAEAGMMGYFVVYPNVPGETNSSMRGKVFGMFLAPDLSTQEVETIMEPMESHMENAKWDDPVFVGSYSIEFPDFTKMWKASNPPQAAGISGRLGSRLLGARALTDDLDALKVALKDSTPSEWLMLGHLVAGPGTRDPPGGLAGGSNAVMPAWRDSYVHIVLPRTWTPLNETEKDTVTTRLRDVETEALRKLSPHGGAYMNEVDPTQPDWQETLYGTHYARLLKIKKKWDPTGVFWCHHCVGSELWEFVSHDGTESGIGEDVGKLCKY